MNKCFIRFAFCIGTSIAMAACGGGGDTGGADETPGTATYSVADLDGTWSTHQLITADTPTFFGSYHGDSIFSNGTMTSTNGILSPNSIVSDSTRTVSLSVDGLMTVVATDLHGIISKSKNVLVETHTESGGAASLAISLRSAGAYTTSDLAGTWYAHSLSVSDDGTLNNNWMHYTQTIDSSGTSTLSNGVVSNGANLSGTGTYSVSSGGVVTASTNSSLHGVMNADKNVTVATWSGSGFAALRVTVKNVGAVFSQADLAGTWMWHVLTAKDTANYWLYGESMIDSAGTVTFTSSRSSGVTNPALGAAGTLTVSSAGIISHSDPAAHGVVAPNKEMIVMTMHFGPLNSAPSLLIGIKK